MNILELDSYNLADTVKFHDRLNARLWDRSEHLRPDVHAKLMEIARDFQEFLGVPDLDVKDITVSGSNAAYNYTPQSDIDLHLVVDLPEADHSEVYRELFDAKKFQYNETHNIKIGGYDVELYVQNPNQEHHSQGIYSLMRNAWVRVPRRRKAEIDDISTRSKYEDLAARIDSTVSGGNHDSMADLMKKIRSMRQSGLEQQGEFGSDNLAFKLLRNNGYIKKLVDARNAARDRELSLAELSKPRQRVQYGFMSESPDGVNPSTKMFLEEPVDESPDGVNPSTKMFLDESDINSVLLRFFKNCIDFLEIKNAPKMVLHHNTDWSEQTGSFGQFDPDAKVLHLATSGRHVLDILRTMAHELTHCKQNEKDRLPDNAGETGSWWEDEANAMAGRIMRHWADEHPEMFKDVSLEESASGYIPKNKREARDPRYSMAVSVDIGPGQVGKEANKLALKTDSQGRPGLLIKSANLRENKIKLSTDSNWYGAEVGDYKATGPVINISADQLVGFEPDDKMNQPKSKANVKKIVTGLQQGDKLPPLLVRKYKKGYQVLDGHHRFWAYKKLGVKSIPVQVVPDKDIEELNENRMPQPSQGQGRYRDLNEPLGPEFKPTMPAGTVKVDVSDVYDWYKLGQHISNLKGLGKHDFGAGPPSTIINFGDEETEHKYIRDLEATGLTTTDIDPVDPNQPPGMKRQKTDPTYNVAENELAESLLQELQVFEDQDLVEIKMTGKNLSKLAQAIPGVMVGLEFEMIVPNTDSPSNDDMEPDYDQDVRVRDIDDAVNFFDDGDYNGRGDIRRLRESMEEDYQNWVMEQIDEDWFGGNGMEFFQEFLDREYPFDRDDAFEEARDEIMTANPDLPQDSEELQQLISARVDEMEASYYVDQWEEQGRYYDYAREEFEDEQRDSLSELDWLSNQGIRFASDVHTQYPVVSWPYWTSSGGDETDVKQVALEFMNAMGYDTIAVGDYHGYGGGYELWNGDDWVNIGKNKPMDAFTVEPDGSLHGNDAGDAGLEFVSPPIPLAQIGDTMAKVQAWAAQNGVYTGKSNKTALHTNVSIPDYSIDKLDYLKAALLLGDEHVLREFDRVTNTYTAPAIAKVKELVRSKPEKAEELLNKMKSQLNAEASKLIHSGSTEKYTSINTKDNRIEFRSPGGDYLSIIADNPQKMVDTINRMVVTLDAAMDPNKYKEEYQKKLYKLLTGQTFGRESRTGAKQEIKQDDKDLLNIFSRYAAGELPRAALKSFVRQAQLERKVKAGKTEGKMWWNVQWDNNRRIEVVATDAKDAIATAVKEWGIHPESIAALSLTATPLRPYEENPQKQGTTVAGRPNNPDGNWYLKNADTDEIFYRFNAANYQDAHTVLQQWKQENPDSNINAVYGQGRDQPAQAQNQGNWGIWIDGNNRFANQPGTYARNETPPLYRFPTQAAAELWIEQQRASRPFMRTDIEVREIEPSTPIPGSTLDLQRQRAAQAQEIPEVPLDIEIAPRRDNWSQDFERRMQAGGTDTSQTDMENRLGWPDQTGDANYEIVDRQTNRPVFLFIANTDTDAWRKYSDWLAAAGIPEDTEDYGWRPRGARGQHAQSHLPLGQAQPTQNSLPGGPNYTVVNDPRDAAQGGIVDVAGEQPAQGSFTGEWKVVDGSGGEVYRFGGVGNSQYDANSVAARWLRSQGIVDSSQYEVYPVMR